MLDTQTQLRQDIIRQIARRLSHEIYPNALGTNQPDNLLQAILQGLGRAIEQQVRFIEEQCQQGFVGIATLRQLFE
ncbi:hypothetical protein D3C77_718630 [compost metagenome]